MVDFGEIVVRTAMKFLTKVKIHVSAVMISSTDPTRMLYLGSTATENLPTISIVRKPLFIPGIGQGFVVSFLYSFFMPFLLVRYS